MAIAPHWWTIVPNLLGRVRPTRVADSPWSTTIEDPERGRVRLVGGLSDPHRSSHLVLLVHGLGGDADSPYVREAVGAVHNAGFAALRLSMRGAGSSTPDFYHAGLFSDLAAALRDPSLDRFERISVIGFSLGGHISLHLARAGNHEEQAERLASVVAICSPLDLGPNALVLDAPQTWAYRRHILGGLERIHERSAGRRERFSTIREWDERVVVPRWGFSSADEYWASQSVGPRLRELAVPTLYVGSPGDPIVPGRIARPHLERARDRVEVRWVERGGHVGFPPTADLGMGGELGVMPQVLRWMAKVTTK